MKIYFLSSLPCALKIDGEYVGKTDGFERYLNLHLRDGHFIEFVPQGNYLSTAFFLTEDILFHPPEGVKLGHAPYVLIIYANEFHQKTSSFQLVAQKNTTAVYVGGESYQLYFHGKIFDLDGDYKNCEIVEYPTFILVRGGHHACVLSRDGLVFNGKFRSLRYDEREGALTLSRDLCDFLGREEVLTYDCKVYPQLISRKEGSAPREISTGFTTAYFLQSLLFGTPCKELLGEELQTADLKGYFGEFYKVLPVGEEKVALVVAGSVKNVFTLRFFSGTIENGKIVNITRIV